MTDDILSNHNKMKAAPFSSAEALYMHRDKDKEIKRLSAKVTELEELQKETLQACSDILSGKFEPFKFNDSNKQSQSAEVE